MNDEKKEAGPVPLITVRRAAPAAQMSSRYLLLKLCAVIVGLVLLIVVLFVAITVVKKAKNTEVLSLLVAY